MKRLILVLFLLLLFSGVASANYSISGQKYNDTNNNHVKDIGEEGLYNWTIKFTSLGIYPDVVLGTVVTDQMGNYTFNGGENGDYILVQEILRDGYVQTYPYDPGNWDIVLSENKIGIDFGNNGCCSQVVDYDPSGYVDDSNGVPLYNAKVTLSNATWTDPCVGASQCFTNSAGYWNTDIYSNGTYNYNITKTGFTTLSGSQAFVIGGTNYNFTLSANEGMLYGTVYEWTNGTAPSHTAFDIKEYKTVSNNANKSDGTYLIYVGGTLTWFGGYVWKIQDIDAFASPQRALIKLLYNGSEFATCITEEGKTCKVAIAEDSNSMLYLTLDVKEVFSGSGDKNAVWVKPGGYIYTKTAFHKIFSILDSIPNAITEWFFGTTQANLQLWEQMRADKIEDLAAHPVTGENPCGGTYQTYGTGDYYYSAILSFPTNGTYNLVDASFKMAVASGSRTIGYAFTDDDIVYPDDTTFPESGYQKIEGISSCNVYPTTSGNFASLDANNNKQIKIWFKIYSGSNPLFLYNAYASAGCVNCNKKPLEGARVYYNYLSKTYEAITNSLGNYNISVPLNTFLVRYTKSGYENKDLTFTFASNNQTQKASDVIINKTTVTPVVNTEDIWVLPSVITQGQQGAVYYRTFDTWGQYQIIIQRFGYDAILNTFPVNPNTESFENLPYLSSGYYIAVLQGSCWYCSWTTIKTANFTIRSSLQSVYWHSTEYYLGSIMKLGIDIPVGVANQNVTAYYPNGSVMYSNTHSAAEGIQTILFNTAYNGSYPPGQYIAMITGNSNQSVTTLYNINLSNYNLTAPSSAVWGKTIAIKYLSPLQSEFHIYTSDGMDAIKPFVVQSTGTFAFNTSKLANKEDTITIKLIQNYVEKKSITVQINYKTITPGWGDATTTGTDAYTVSKLDGYVGTMGYGINNTTRFMFSVIIIVLFIILAALATKGNSQVAVACGFLPFAFFTLISFNEGARAAGIEFLPKWPAVMFIILVALSLKIFR